MRILFVSHRFPYPPRSGSKIRAFHMIRHLGNTHEVTVASLARSDTEFEEAHGIDRYCARHFVVRVTNPVQVARMFGRLLTRSSLSSGFFYAPDFARLIRQEMEARAYDLVIAHSSSVAQYVVHLERTSKLLDFCDMDSQKWLAYGEHRPFPIGVGYRIEGIKLRAEERRLAAAFDLCTTATRAEANTLEGYGTACATAWFPNGVDAEYFAPGDEAYDSNTLSFVGRMDYYPNRECMVRFCRDVWPLIRKARPRARLLIVGADPTPSVRRLGRIPGVAVTGSVPDVRPFLRQSAAMVAPLAIARGTQNKILEAMASGVPVVTSSIAARGVDAVAEDHLMVADDPNAVALAALRLMNDRGARDRLAVAGRERMLSHQTWAASMRRLDAIVDRCVRIRSTGPRPARWRTSGSALR